MFLVLTPEQWSETIHLTNFFFEINCWHMSFLGALGFVFKLFKSFVLSTTFQEIAKFTATEARAIVANHRWTPSNVAFSVWTA